MKKSDFKKTLNEVKLKQLDMLFWDFKTHNYPKPTIKPIPVAQYTTKQVLAIRFYKIIHL